MMPSNIYGSLSIFAIVIYPNQIVDMDSDAKAENIQAKRKEGECIALPPFGLATYKMQGDMWMSDGDGQDREKIMSLLSAADSWLKQLRVEHHDFNHFIGIRHG